MNYYWNPYHPGGQDTSSVVRTHDYYDFTNFQPPSDTSIHNRFRTRRETDTLPQKARKYKLLDYNPDYYPKSAEKPVLDALTSGLQPIQPNIVIDNVFKQYDSGILPIQSDSVSITHPSIRIIPKENHVTQPNYFHGSYDWIFLLMILSAALIGWIRIFYFKALVMTLKATINYQTTMKLVDEKNTLSQRVSITLYSLSFINTGLFAFECVDFYSKAFSPIDGLLAFIYSTLGIAGFFYLKALLYRFSGWLINANDKISEFLSGIGIYTKSAGILLIPVVFVIPYVPNELTPFFIYLGLTIIILMYLLQLFRGLILSFRARLSFLYTFLYLCALEILPLIIVYKLLMEAIIS